MNMSRTSRILVYLVLLLGLHPFTGLGLECEEKISIDGVWYSIGEQWCGRKMDPALRADPDYLTKLPDSLNYKGLGIYLDKEAREAFVNMADAALGEGIPLYVKSGYRSFRYQEEIITRKLNEGLLFKDAIRFIAPPGYSEHESGKAVDLASDRFLFIESSAYGWLKQNAARFGFRESYSRRKDSLIPWEPWHWYYIGEQGFTDTEKAKN